MELSIENNSAKKSAFSYLELIISMGLVVMVVFLTTPFLVHMEKTSSAKFGEFRAYAKYISPEKGGLKCGGCAKEGESGWFLFQNTRYGETEYLKPDEPCPFAPDNQTQICKFVLPTHVYNYKVHLYGAGGGGSMGYSEGCGSYDSEGNCETLKVARGKGGHNGQFLTKMDTLTKAVDENDDSELSIFKCQDVALPNNDNDGPGEGYNKSFYFLDKLNTYSAKNCIGIGGDGSKSSDVDASNNIYTYNNITDIKRRFLMEKFDESQLQRAKIFYTGDVIDNLTKYLSDEISEEERKNLKDELEDKIGEWRISYGRRPLSLESVGVSGGDSFFRFDDNMKSAISVGGEGAMTYIDDVEEFSISDAGDNSSSEFYYDGSNYIIAGLTGIFSNAGLGGAGGDCKHPDSPDGGAYYCSGSEPVVNECQKDNKADKDYVLGTPCPKDYQKSFNFGAGGGGSAIVIEPSRSYNSMNNYEGGRGAGGAVVIEWN